MATLVLTADWSADFDSGGDSFPGDGSDYSGGDGASSYRVAIKFNIASLSTSAVVTRVDLSIAVSSVTSAGALLWDIGPYGGTGVLGDPETDAGTTAYSRCNVAADLYVDNTTQFRTTGVKTFSALGSQANSDLQNARAAGEIFSIGVMETTSTTTNNRAEFFEYSAASASNRPTLTITYADPTDISGLSSGTGLATAGGVAAVAAVAATAASASAAAAGLAAIAAAAFADAGSSAVADGAEAISGGGGQPLGDSAMASAGGGIAPTHYSEKQRFRIRKEKSKPRVYVIKTGSWPTEEELARAEREEQREFSRFVNGIQPSRASPAESDDEEELSLILSMLA